LHQDRRIRGFGRTLEGAEQSVTGEVDLVSARHLGGLSEQVEKGAADLVGCLVAKRGQLLRRPHLVDKEKRPGRHHLPPAPEPDRTLEEQGSYGQRTG
jgi:hypothetical protein